MDDKDVTTMSSTVTVDDPHKLVELELADGTGLILTYQSVVTGGERSVFGVINNTSHSTVTVTDDPDKVGTHYHVATEDTDGREHGEVVKKNTISDDKRRIGWFESATMYRSDVSMDSAELELAPSDTDTDTQVSDEVCIECGESHNYIYDDECLYCTDADPDTVDDIEVFLHELADRVGYATMFWSLDEAYNRFDGELSDGPMESTRPAVGRTASGGAEDDCESSSCSPAEPTTQHTEDDT